MVKVFLFESVKDGWNHACEVLRKQSFSCLLFPSLNTLHAFKRFYPKYFPTPANCFTPNTFLEKICQELPSKPRTLPTKFARLALHSLSSDGLRHLKEEDALTMFDHTFFQRTSTKNSLIRQWLLENQLYTFSLLVEQLKANPNVQLPCFDSIFAYGFFDPELHGPLFKLMRQVSAKNEWFTFLPNTLHCLQDIADTVQWMPQKAPPKGRCCSYVQAPNFLEEVEVGLEYVNTLEKTENPSTVIMPYGSPELVVCLQNSLDENSEHASKATEDDSNFFDRINGETLQSFIRWLIDPTLDNFFDYLKRLRDLNVLNAKEYQHIEEAFVHAFERCLSHSYRVLYSFVEEKFPEIPLQKFTLPLLPEEASLQQFFEPIRSVFPQAALALSTHENNLLGTFPITLSKNAFMAWLLSLAETETQRKQPLLSKNTPFLSSLESALSFPWSFIWLPFFNKNIWPTPELEALNFSKSLPHLAKAIAHLLKTSPCILVSQSGQSIEGEKLDSSIFKGLKIVSTFRQKTLVPSYSQLKKYLGSPSRQMLKLEQPLLAPQSFSSLKLAPDTLVLSCKKWERLKLAPWQTWLEAILKTKPYANYTQTNLKQKVIGEWTHEWLSFSQEARPLTLKNWQSSIHHKAHQVKKFLANVYQKNERLLPKLLEQCWQKALNTAFLLAKCCEPLLSEKNFLYSEWPLQRRFLSPALEPFFPGRLDLLVADRPIIAPTFFQHANVEIVDFKTATTLSFTPGQINQGKYFQLLLYGHMLQRLGANKIILTLLDANGIKRSHDFDTLFSQTKEVWTWFQSTLTTGLQPNLPKEALENLPLAFIR